MEEILDQPSYYQEEDEPVKYAGFWTRTGAALIDMLVMTPAALLLYYTMMHLKYLPLVLFVTILQMLYKPYMESVYGATIGKMAMRIRVLEHSGRTIDLTQSIFRNLPWIISALANLITIYLVFHSPDFAKSETFMSIAYLMRDYKIPLVSNMIGLIFIISAIMVGVRKNHEGLHDLWARTIVVCE